MSINNDEGRIISVRAGYKDPVTGEFKRDLFWERAGAESGDPEAMIQLGFAYSTGDGVERDPVKAVEYYRQAAELDEPVGQYNMGIQCARGEGIKRDFAASIDWMEKARDNGDKDAIGQLKILKDAPEIERKAYAGDAEAQARFSTLLANYPSEANKKESVEMAERSIEQGCPRGYHCLGTRYDYGIGVEKDPVKAAELYKKGADLGSPECQYCYAVCFKSGSGVKQDDDAALEWAIKAAEQGHAAAAASISLESGSHPQPIMPVERIIGYLLKAEEKDPGDVRVAAQLGVQYINLEPSDYEKSIFWYERAAELGDENAGHMAHVYHYRQKLIDEGKLPENVGVMEYIGYIQANNLMAEAFGQEPAQKIPDYDIDELLDGIEEEDPDAIKQYAYACFFEGEKVYDRGIDKARAMSLLEELSETDSEAAGIIGLLYWQGAGVEQDDLLAEKWLARAVENGETNLETTLESVRAEIGPMPAYEFKLTYTKKGDRKQRSELVRVGDRVSMAMNADGSRINFLTKAGDVGDVSADSWLKGLLAVGIPYQAEVITSIPYSKLDNKRKDPVIEIRLQIDATKTEMKKRLGLSYIPGGIYGGVYSSSGISTSKEMISPTDTEKEAVKKEKVVLDPQKIQERDIGPAQAILDWMVPGKLYTAQDITDGEPELTSAGITVNRVSAILTQLTNAGEIRKTVLDGRNYYELKQLSSAADSAKNNDGKSVEVKPREEIIHRENAGSWEAEKKMLDKVDTVLAEARKAGAKYEVSAIRIEQTVSRTTINLSSESSLNSLRSIVEDCASACNDLYLSYQNLIHELDAELRGLLANKPGAYALKSVAGTIEWLNEESRIQNNYAAQFDGVDLGQLVKKEYLPRPENLDTEKFWKAQYNGTDQKGDAEARWKEKLSEHLCLAAEEECKAKDNSRKAEQETRELIKNFKEEEKEKVNKAIEEKKKEFQAQYSVIRERMEYCRPAKDLLYFRAFNYAYVTGEGEPRINYDENHVGCVVRRMHDLKQIVCLSVGVVGLDKDGRCQLSNIDAVSQKKYGLKACTKWRNVKKIDACNSSNQVLGLLEDGHCVATIPDYDVGVHRVSSWSDIVDIICEQYYAVGLRKDGTVLISGTGSIPDNLRKLYSGQKDILAIFPYDTWHFAALTKDGSILPDIAEMKEPAMKAENVVAIAKNMKGPVFLQADGTVVATKEFMGGWGGQKNEGYSVKQLENVVAVYAGRHEFAALCEDGIFQVYDDYRNSIYALNKGEPIFNSYREYSGEILKKGQEEQARIEKKQDEGSIRAARRANNQCQYCGGRLEKKLFSWKCAECGRKKDY